jgi:hypothetical protein
MPINEKAPGISKSEIETFKTILEQVIDIFKKEHKTSKIERTFESISEYVKPVAQFCSFLDAIDVDYSSVADITSTVAGAASEGASPVSKISMPPVIAIGFSVFDALILIKDILDLKNRGYAFAAIGALITYQIGQDPSCEHVIFKEKKGSYNIFSKLPESNIEGLKIVIFFISYLNSKYYTSQSKEIVSIIARSAQLVSNVTIAILTLISSAVLVTAPALAPTLTILSALFSLGVIGNKFRKRMQSASILKSSLAKHSHEMVKLKRIYSKGPKHSWTKSTWILREKIGGLTIGDYFRFKIAEFLTTDENLCLIKKFEEDIYIASSKEINPQHILVWILWSQVVSNATEKFKNQFLKNAFHSSFSILKSYRGYVSLEDLDEPISKDDLIRSLIEFMPAETTSVF